MGGRWSVTLKNRGRSKKTEGRTVAGTHILYTQQQLHQVNRVGPVCAERIDPVPTEIQHVCKCNVDQVKSDLTKLLCFS